MAVKYKPNSAKALLFIFILLTLILCTAGYILYLHQKQDITSEKHNELVAINNLKKEQVVNWRYNIISIARTIYYDQPIITHIHEWEQNIDTAKNALIIMDWANSLLKEFDYTNALLVNPKGKVVFNTNPADSLTGFGKQIIAQAIQKKEIIISDFELYNNTISISIAVPLYMDPDNNSDELLGVAFLNIDPNKFLFPLIKNWPTASKTGETVIVRREGDKVLYLNELRHVQNAAMRFSKPLSDTLLPASYAVLGHKGIMEGYDYRGVNVLADIESIPKTNWFIITKIDTEEVYLPVRRQAVVVVSFTLLLISLCAFIIYTIWKNQTKKSEQERRALESHFDYLVKYANDIILLTDMNGNIKEMNDKAVSSYGYSHDELLDLNISLLRAPETKDEVSRILQLLEETDGIRYETLQARKNKEVFPVESSARKMEVDGIIYYQFIVRDITERKKFEAELINAKEKAEESDRLKTAFLNNMSHEIRTPMNGILGFSELLDDDSISADERRQYINIINSNSQHLLSIINDIIDISKIHSNQLTVSMVNFNLNALLDDLKLTYEKEKLLNGKTNIELIVEKGFEDSDSTIISDDVRLRQILLNLLSNAFKFTKAGFIKFGYEYKSGILLFYVQDTGKGIAKEKQAIIFERFRQEEVTYTREFGGTGLGLSISNGLVELLGGDMCLESDEGVGTTFYFSIPYDLN